jgi:hypothetical protein
VSPAPMMAGVVAKDRRATGAVARRMGRVSADCIADGGGDERSSIRGWMELGLSQFN